MPPIFIGVEAKILDFEPAHDGECIEAMLGVEISAADSYPPGGAQEGYIRGQPPGSKLKVSPSKVQSEEVAAPPGRGWGACSGLIG
eukprot:1187469-Prorocentrum_minimum.AAC.1